MAVKTGIFGEVHPAVAVNFEINEPVYLFEIDLKTLSELMTGQKTYTPLPKFPAVVRDLALVVDIEVPHQKILDIFSGFSMISKVEIFDIYSGEQVPAGKKSMAYRLTFQNPARTLKEEEINGVMKGILNKLKNGVGAVLRS